MKCSACHQEGHRCNSPKCPLNHQRTPTSKNTRCSACNQEGHRRNNKKCPSNRQQTPTGTSTNTRRSACDQEGHRRNSKKCPSTSNQQIPTRNPKWKDSEAEKELRKMLENDHNGHYHALSSEQVRNHRELFRVYDRTKFQDYLKKLKEKIEKKAMGWCRKKSCEVCFRK